MTNCAEPARFHCVATKRRGRGRPRVLEDPVRPWVQMERKDAKAAEVLAKKKGISFAEFVRRAVKAYIRRSR